MKESKHVKTRYIKSRTDEEDMFCSEDKVIQFINIGSSNANRLQKHQNLLSLIQFKQKHQNPLLLIQIKLNHSQIHQK